jgi:hypothetical protein
MTLSASPGSIFRKALVTLAMLFPAALLIERLSNLLFRLPWVVCPALLAGSLLRLLCILPIIRTQPRSRRKSTANILIVLGSGGHTAEMLRLLQHLDFAKYTRRVYIVSSGDSLSHTKAAKLDHDKEHIGQSKVIPSRSYRRIISVMSRGRGGLDSLG